MMIHEMEGQVAIARKQVFLCDGCGNEIKEWSRLCMMRHADTIPEDMTVYYVHRTCAIRFMERHGGRWEQYSTASPEASWFLPILGQRRSSEDGNAGYPTEAARAAFTSWTEA